MSDTLKEIADNLGVGLVNGSYLNGIADYYGVDLATSTDLMKDLLTAVGGDPSTSTDYLQDIVLELGGTVTINGNWMEAWEAITAVAPAPVNSTLPVISGTTTLGSVLTTTNGTWTNSPTSYTYQWKRGATNIGTNASTYTLVIADSTAAITCVVTATNAGGSTPATSNTITAGNYAPVNTVAPVISGATYVGDVLTTTNGTWTGSPTFTYQWFNENDTENIVGATSSTYTLGSVLAGIEISCKVTGTNAAGSDTGVSNVIGTTALYAPVNIDPPAIPNDVTWQVGMVIFFSYNQWDGNPVPTLTYQWQRDGVNISGETNTTYLLGYADEGYMVGVKCTATNSEGTDFVLSNTVLIEP
jgi:hypothetical protein